MPAKPSVFDQFVGLDLRAQPDVADPRSFRTAKNLELTLNGGVETRPGLRPVCTLDANSVGLYAANGSLRAIIPGGQSIALAAFGDVTVLYDPITSNTGTYNTGTATMTQASDLVTVAAATVPVNAADQGYFTYDGFSSKILQRISATQIKIANPWTTATIAGVAYSISGFPTAHALGDYTKVVAAETYGADSGFGAFPYLVVYRSTTQQHEHHWIRSRPIDNTVAVSTRIILPFTPGPCVVSIAGKLWADDPTNGVVRFSSTADGPTDWTERNDAGYIAVLNFISGSRDMTALSYYDGKLAVFFNDAIQLWEVNPNPAQIKLVRVLNGPGTDYAKSVVNTIGDLFYFSQGGFRSLTTAAINGQLVENDDIGSKIQALTKAQAAPAYGPVALWSQTRGQFLCAFDKTVYCYRYSPKTKVKGWTTWEFTVNVEYMVELDGFVYIRSGNTVYKLDPAYDDGSAFDLKFQGLSMQMPSVRKRWDFFRVTQSGTAKVEHYLNPSDATVFIKGPTLVGSTASAGKIPVGSMSHSIATRFTGTGAWSFDRIVYEYTPLKQ